MRYAQITAARRLAELAGFPRRRHARLRVRRPAEPGLLGGGDRVDWDNFYERLGGGQFFDALRADMKAHYDYTLIDSRTGLSDIADICTVHLPDILVDCFTLNDQSIDGRGRDRPEHRPALPLPQHPGPAGPDADRRGGEGEGRTSGRALARARFDRLPARA